MFNAKSLLDNLTGGQGVKGLTDKAKGAWDNQSSLGKGAIAGGLLGVLLTGGGRRLIGTGLKVGGAALIGGLAYQAYNDWKNGKDPKAAAAPVGELAAPHGTAFLPADEGAANDLAHKLVQAMVAAAKADGHVTPDERARIDDARQRLPHPFDDPDGLAAADAADLGQRDEEAHHDDDADGDEPEPADDDGGSSGQGVVEAVLQPRADGRRRGRNG